jgi:hypothetical protein
MWFLIRVLLIIILFLLIRQLWRSLSGAVKTQGGLPPRPDFSPQPLVYDPQCGLHLPLNDALVVHTGKGMLYFCSRECRDAYLAKTAKIQE